MDPLPAALTTSRRPLLDFKQAFAEDLTAT